jgi:hypothetical protein
MGLTLSVDALTKVLVGIEDICEDQKGIKMKKLKKLKKFEDQRILMKN